VKWADLIGEGGQDEVRRVREKIKIGKDTWRNFGDLTKVEIFSGCFKPVSMRINGEKAVGLVAENRRGEYFFYVLFKDVPQGRCRRSGCGLTGEASCGI